MDMETVINQTRAAYDEREGPIKVFDLVEGLWTIKRYRARQDGVRYRPESISHGLESDLKQLHQFNIG